MASIAFGVSKSSASTFRTVACVTDNLNKAQQDGKQKKIYTFKSESMYYLSLDFLLTIILQQLSLKYPIYHIFTSIINHLNNTY